VLSEEAQNWSAKGTMRNRGVAFVSSISGFSDVSSLVPRPVDSAIAGPEGAKNLAGKSPPPDSNPFNDGLALKKSRLLVKQNRCKRRSPIRVPQRGQLFIGAHNETLSVVAMRVCNPDRSSLRIKS
jgi:hypothetical protein